MMDLAPYRAFAEKHNHTPTLDELFNDVLLPDLRESIANLNNDDTPHNELIGLCIDISPKNRITYNGSMSATKYHYWHERGGIIPKDADVGSPGFIGRIWFRTTRELKQFSSLSTLFTPLMMRLGGGLYSTWDGPWNVLGKQIEDLNVGLPWEDKGKLAAYAYDLHFFTADIPGLDQMEVMLKLQDKQWESKYTFMWEADGQPKRDQVLLSQLRSLKEQQ